jgi:hypothetical protein
MQAPDPAFWLTFETEGCGQCEHQLVAVASSTLPIDDDPDVRFLVGIAWAFHAEQPDRRMVSISDLTRWLAFVGLDWERLDIDLGEALSGVCAARPTSTDAWFASQSPEHGPGSDHRR